MTQCHFLYEGWDCGRPSKERCECSSQRYTDASIRCSGCVDHTHEIQGSGFIRLFNGHMGLESDFDKRMEAIT